MNNKNIVFAESEAPANIEESLLQETNNLLESIDFSELENLLDDSSYSSLFFGDRGFKEFVEAVISGEEDIDLEGILNATLGGVAKAFQSLLKPMLAILSIVLICLLFNNVKSGKVSGVGELIYFICFSIVIIILVSLCAEIINQSKNTLINLQSQMNVLFPILLSLMGVMGGVVSVKAYTPMFAFLSNTISNVFVYVLFPLFVLSLILSILSNLSKNTRFDKLNKFIGSLFKWIVGVVFALFMAFISFKGLSAGASDGISIKATKYAIKNYIPMLGGYISDGFELVKAGGLLVKNATGFAGILLLAGTIVGPIISIAILELVLKLLAGIIEPIGDQRSSNFLFGFAKSFRLLVVIFVGVALMYFLTIFLATCTVSNFV